MRPLLAALIVAISAASASAGENAPEGDLARLQGEWESKVGPRKDIPIIVEIKGNDVALTMTSPQGREFHMKGRIKVDESTNPKSMDWLLTASPEGQSPPREENLAIYTIDGDTLTICSGGRKQPRPGEFKAGAGGPPHLLVLTRKKDEAPPPK